MLDKIKDIGNSWLSTINHTEEQEQEATRRQAICNDCPHKNRLNICSLCGCPLMAKVYSQFGCDIDKW